ncbi:MAG: M14 family zinc carboxypeptidase [Planctomycetota bacterium]
MLLSTLLVSLAPLAVQAGAVEAAPAPAPPATDTPLPEGHVHPVQHLVRVTSTPLGLLRMQRLDLDVISLDLAGGEATLLVTPDEVEALRDLRLEVEVQIEDLAAHYARRLAQGGGTSSLSAGTTYGQWLTPPFGQGGMGGYYTFAEIESVLDQMRATYPQFVSQKMSIGQTIQGRDIWMIRVSDNPDVDEDEPEARIDAMHHAREPQGMQTTLYFLSYLFEEYGSDPVATYLLDERELYVVPCVNPDGYEFNRSQAPGGGGLWRKNRRNNGDGTRGVDLNRNYPFQWGGNGSSGSTSSETYRGPSPSSEPETQAMIQFISSRAFETALSVHTFSDLWLAPWGYVEAFPPDWSEIQEVGDLAVEENGYPHAPGAILLYVADGVTFDYDYGVHGTFGWTPEIGSQNDGFWPPQSRIVPLAEENVLAFARTVLAAGAWTRPVSATIVEVGDGDGVIEGGESADIAIGVRNSGRVASGAVILNLTSGSPEATVAIGQDQVGPVASFQTLPNISPLRLDIAPGTPPGTEILYTVTLTESGRVEVYAGSFTLGLRTIAAFDFEGPGNDGWAVGAPNDASTGEWTRGDPIGTAAQPESDVTPEPGTDCWFTGQGSIGGSLGEADVDGGRTTLVSPTFDVAGAQSASIRFARWYSNDTGGSPGADVFEIDLSDDGGATWTQADVVGPTGAGTSGGWIEAEIDVDSFVALTDQLRVRFIASDLGNGSIVEAAIDEVVVSAVDPPGCPPPVRYCVLSPNNWSSGAVISAVGSTDVADNDLTLIVANANPQGFGLFFYGQGRTQAPAGNGSVCIAGAFTRLPPVQSDLTGFATYSIDFPSLMAPIANGETWNFQYWLRDVGGAQFNFSDGLEITFCQ